MEPLIPLALLVAAIRKLRSRRLIFRMDVATRHARFTVVYPEALEKDKAA